ncbi:MAG: hypothetical protein SOU05_06240 [Atopobium sp.]|uniref:hypothetical protein n=1 Tax=Atopobium sp. TaxID=1872650 RepID=UPI002A74D24D|nr:hypothetical protein [Atopobium sp.]MDY2788985.1 hypothetical protein [Atopobium sp.]
MTSLLTIDLKEGLYQQRKYLVLVVIISLFFGITSYVDLALQKTTAVFSVADLFVALFEGVQDYSQLAEHGSSFPFSWFLMMFLLSYITLWYPYKDIYGFGQHICMRLGTRWSWWLSKCLWICCTVLIFWVLVFVSLCICSLLFTGHLSFTLSNQLPNILGWGESIQIQPQGLVPFLILTVFSTIALCLLQLFISLLVHPLFAFLLSAVILTFSMFTWNVPFLFMSFAIAQKAEVIVGYGHSFITGIFITTTVSILSAVFGGYVISRQNLLKRGLQ